MADSRSWKQASSGTYIDGAIPRSGLIAFLVVAFAFILIPFIGMLWAPTETTTENRELATTPDLLNENHSLNATYLADWGDYFADHFAYRNELVSANSYVRSLLDVSDTDQVVIGSNGWYYYGGTLPDYLGQSQLSERELQNIAHNLALIQGFVEAQGASFACTFAPNKNSLYADAMPYYYVRYEGASNIERLIPYLQKAGVHYVNLESYFEQQMTDEAAEGFHYLKEDSHWDNYWALLATNQLMNAVGKEPFDLDIHNATYRAGFIGDLISMLYPTTTAREKNYYYAGINDGEGMSGSLWSYVEGSAVTDDFIQTQTSHAFSLVGENAQSESVLMFRDSFGNALVPYWASQYDHAVFSKLIPYNLTLVSLLKPNAVIIERAERHMDYLAYAAPIMPSPQLNSEILSSKMKQTPIELEVQKNGDMWELKGELPQSAHGTIAYVAMELPDENCVVFNPFWIALQDEDGITISDYGIQLYIPQSFGDISTARFTVYSV